MVYKKYIRVVILAAVIVLFWISYNYGINKYKDSNVKRNNKNPIVSDLDRTVNNIYIEDKVEPESDIIVKTTYKKCGEYELKELGKAEDLNLNTSKDLNEYCLREGYTLESNLKSAQILLSRTRDTYCPNKYVLGIADRIIDGTPEEFVAIFKTDNNGEMKIEDESSDITNIKVKRLRPADKELLTNGNIEFEFDTKEEAENKLGDYI